MTYTQASMAKSGPYPVTIVLGFKKFRGGQMLAAQVMDQKVRLGKGMSGSPVISERQDHWILHCRLRFTLQGPSSDSHPASV